MKLLDQDFAFEKSTWQLANMYGSAKLIEKFILKGADIDGKIFNNQSPLFYACKHNKTDNAIILHECGATICDDTSRLIADRFFENNYSFSFPQKK
jgi:hypothetical protein